MLNQFRGYMVTHAAARPFNGIMAMQEHLDHCKRVEDYVNGQSRNLPHVPTTCDGDCSIGKWLHSASGRNCKDIKLINSLCRNCTEFREAASHAVLLTYTGDSELAKEALQPGRIYSDASEKFQQNLVDFNMRYSAWAEDLM